MPKKKRTFVKHKGGLNNLKLVGAILALILIFAFVYRKHFFIGVIDTSLNGSEIPKNTQRVIPPDVKKEVEKQKKIYKLTELPNYRVPILMYHYVEYVQNPNDKLRVALDTPPFLLEEQLKALKSAGFTFITASELENVLTGKAALPKNPVVITFDDGYRDFYTDAYPILKKYNVKATQYVIAGFLNRPNHLTDEEVKQIAKDGLVEIGAHTVTHLPLKGQPAADVYYQITESKKILEDLTGKKVVSFAYPFGSFDQQAINDLQKAGFTSSVSTIPGIEQNYLNRFFLYRLRPGGRLGDTLANWLKYATFNN